VRIRASAWLLMLGLLFGAAGLGYGLVGVQVDNSPFTSCGNSFETAAPQQGFTIYVGGQTCAETLSARRAVTWVLLSPGIAAIVMSSVVFVAETRSRRVAGSIASGPADTAGPDEPGATAEPKIA
jgi:hypothetical protein